MWKDNDIVADFTKMLFRYSSDLVVKFTKELVLLKQRLMSLQ